jgi:hypothetical protein
MAKVKAASKRSTAQPLSDSGWLPIVQRGYWLLPLLLFLTLRLFSADRYYMLGGDQCTYLTLGRTFPKHQVFNNELFLLHPPLFGYIIGLFHLVLPLLASGLTVTLLFASLNFFVLRNLARFEELPSLAIFVGLIYLAVNRAAVHYDCHVARVSILVCATTAALLAFVRFLRMPGRRTLTAAIAANVFCLLISDQALMLLPCEAILLLFRRGHREWKQYALLAASSGAAALVWPVVRLVEYLNRTDLPAGIDGTIEFTKNLPLLAAIQPNFLPFTNAQRSLTTQTSLSLLNLKFDLLAGLPSDLLLIPSPVAIAVVLFLAVVALARPARRSQAIQWLILSFIFLLPAGMGMNEWYSSAFIAPFALLMMEGAAACLAWLAAHAKVPENVPALGLSSLCIFGIAFWLNAPPRDVPSFRPHGGTHFLFTRPTITRASLVSRFFDPLPYDTGVMAPVLMGPEVAYLTDKRVVGLPFDPELLDRFIKEYQISYLITTNQYLVRYPTALADKYQSALVSRYIVEHPDRYRMVHSVQEHYRAFYPTITYYVFQVVR